MAEKINIIKSNIKIELTPALKQFYEFKEKYPDAVLLFRCGDYYEAYEQDAEACEKILGITLSMHNGRKEAAFPHHALDVYLPKLIRVGKRVAICDQLESPKNLKKGESV